MLAVDPRPDMLLNRRSTRLEVPKARLTNCLVGPDIRKTLSLEIKVTAWMLMKTGKTLGKLEAEVQVKIGAQRFELLASIRKSRYDQEFRKIKKANIKKLKNLSSSQASIIVNTQQKCVFNFTDVVLPEEVNRILTLEPNFGLPVTNKDVKPVLFIKDIEYALDQVNIEG
ncbi:hypothetical protein KQX54_000749 [Cotesia glomerata]|uniref:Uncharacterized protein n=1 Tax=Cotesia glomerata TaxID=32391 RepID=A0AAV7HSP2_COTGL|nr:hypothetical protein KQX54_000749 [Cotesia glomerata]